MTFTLALLPRRRFIWSTARPQVEVCKMIWQNKSVSVSRRPGRCPRLDYIYKTGDFSRTENGAHCSDPEMKMTLIIKYQSKSVQLKVARRDLFADRLCKFDTRPESITMQIPGLHHAGPSSRLLIGCSLTKLASD